MRFICLESGYTPLLNDVREKAVVLRVKPGQNHTFAILPVDRIGNIQNLQLAGSEYFYTVYTPVPEGKALHSIANFFHLYIQIGFVLYSSYGSSKSKQLLDFFIIMSIANVWYFLHNSSAM